MPSQRQRRVQELLKEHVSRILQSKLRDPRLGLVTVTDVELSPDLKHARVFVSVYGDQRAVETSMGRLKAGTGFVRGQLGHSVELRHTPELTFVYDQTVERAARITELFNEIAAESNLELEPGIRGETPDAEGPDAGQDPAGP